MTQTVHGYAALAPKAELTPFEYQLGPVGAYDVDVRVTHCGVCHSDLGMIDNDFGFTRYPLVPGHEIVGVVTAVGGEVKSLSEGTRVGIGWFSGSCGTCEWCQRGRQSLCSRARPTIGGRHGGWADLVRVDARFAVPLPDALPSEVAGPLFCAGSTVFTPMQTFGVRSSMRVAVVGVGGLGHLAVQFLAKMGCDVTAISTSHNKDEEARRMGASHFIATRETDELKKAAGSFDFILSTVSASVNWVEYINALRPQGRLVLVGIPESEIHFPLFPLLAEKSVSGAMCGSPSDTATMLEFAARNAVHPVVEAFPLSEVNAAVERARNGKVRYRAVLTV